MSLGVAEVLIIALVVLVLFGAKRLPDAARSIGRSMRIFRSEIRELDNDPGTNGATANETRAAAN